MPKIYQSLTITTLQSTKSSNTKIIIPLDLAKILNYFENRQQESLHFASINYQNPSIRPESCLIGGGRFFAKQLSLVVNDATPNSHFYWFKKLYDFYQNPQNKTVLLEDAIQRVLAPHIAQLEKTFGKYHQIYISIMLTKGDFVDKIISQRNKFSKQLTFFKQEMPAQLMVQALTLGSIETQNSKNQSNNQEESKMSSPNF